MADKIPSATLIFDEYITIYAPCWKNIVMNSPVKDTISHQSFRETERDTERERERERERESINYMPLTS
jgi:hypothetical protein